MTDHDLTKDWKEFVELLNSHKIDYLIVGAWALAFHGRPRITGDMDVLIRTSPDNISILLTALNKFGFGSLNLKIEDFSTPDIVIQLGYEPNRIDLLTSISGVQFEQAWRNKCSLEIDGIKFVFLGVEDLILNKAATGRSKDLADLTTLREIQKRTKKQDRSACE